jgi:hypothetical protein
VPGLVRPVIRTHPVLPYRNTPTPKPVRERDWWVLLGMAVAATSATIASFSGLRGLAELAGWPERLAWLLPITLDAYAMTSARVWLADLPVTDRARRFARANALGAISASITGNAAFHTAQVGLLEITWPVIVLVGAIPAAVLGLTAHLHALQGPTHTPPVPAAAPVPGARPNPYLPEITTTRPLPSRPKRAHRTRSHRPDAELLAAARVADTRYRATHDGRPITRDALRTALSISGSRATELRRKLTAAPPVPDRKENDTHR